jgi:hypothetical protein
LLLLAGACAALLTFRDYGITWDEWAQSRYGQLVLAYFRSGFRDTRCNEFRDLRFYGPLFESLTAALSRTMEAPKPEVRHLAGALTGLLTVYATMRYGRVLTWRWAGLFSGAALLLWPRFYGHSFNNSKDVPFACACAFAMLAIASYARSGRAAGAPARAGVAIGAALALRAGGLFLLGYVPLAVWLERAAREPGAAPQRLGNALREWLLITVLAWTIMVLPWPAAHRSPIAHPLLAAARSTEFPAPMPSLFEGRFLRGDELPWYYLPKYLLLTTPVSFLFFALPGALAAWKAGAGGRLLLCWLALPTAYAMARRPPLYDEIRHFLFLLPAAALLVGLGVEVTRQAAARSIGRAAWLIPLALLEPLPQLVQLHPYQTSYFNALAWRSGNPSLRYDTDYWLSSYKEATEWLNAQVRSSGRPLRVLVAAPPPSGPLYCASYYAGPGLQLTSLDEVAAASELPSDYDAYLATTRARLHDHFGDVPIRHTVARQGMVFSVVRLRDGWAVP